MTFTHPSDETSPRRVFPENMELKNLSETVSPKVFVSVKLPGDVASRWHTVLGLATARIPGTSLDKVIPSYCYLLATLHFTWKDCMEKITEVNDEEATQIVTFAPYDVEGRVQLDPHSLNVAIAHMSAQADAQIQLQYRQSQQILQQQAYVETRVQHVQAEVNARNEEIAHFIRQNHVDSTAIDNHINIKLQAVLEEARLETAANSQIAFQRQAASLQSMEERVKIAEAALAQTQACVAQQAQAQHDMERRLSAAFTVVKAETAESADQRTKELLGAYFKHHAAQTKTAIAIETENSEKRITAHFNVFEDRINSRLETATKQTEKKHEPLAIAEGGGKEVARAEAVAKRLVGELVTRQLEDAAMLGISAVGHITAMTSSLPVVPINSVSAPVVQLASGQTDVDNDSSDQDMNLQFFSTSTDENSLDEASNQPSLTRQGRNDPAYLRQQLIAAEQGKVAARALRRSVALKQTKKAKETATQRTTARMTATTPRGHQLTARNELTNRECLELALQLAEKLKAARKAKPTRFN